MPIKLTQSTVLTNFHNAHGNRYDYSLVKYVRASSKVKIICKVHGEFEQQPRHHSSGQGCLLCCNDRFTKTREQFIKDCVEIHGDRFDYSLTDYINNATLVSIICKEHGIFKQNPSKHLLGQGCPICNSSMGELAVEKWLQDNQIDFESQKRFDGCRNKYPLPFDFYLPESNMIIEYDGEQHYNPIKHWGGEEYLKKIQTHDAIKNKYCKDNNITLIRISYKDTIENILTKEFDN